MQSVQSDVGKTVRVKWLRKDKVYGGKRTNNYMCKYRLRKATITEVIPPGEVDKYTKEVFKLEALPELTEDFTMYHINLDSGKHFWTKEMFFGGKKKLEVE